jgi:hypothetical protein
MGILDFFTSPKAIAENLEKDNKKLIKIWNDYIKKLPEKSSIISKLKSENIKDHIQRLDAFIDEELVFIAEEDTEAEMVLFDIRKLEHLDKIKTIQRLEECLGYAETRYEYLHSLVENLQQTLKDQGRAIESLQKDTTQIENLKKLHLIELELIDKMKKFGKYNQKLETFQEAFLSLVTGEKTIERMTERQKKLFKKVSDGMRKVYSTDEKEQIDEGMTAAWAGEILDGLGDKIRELEAEGFLEGHNPHIDFEFVNKPEFINFVREKYVKLSRSKVAEDMIKVFVFIFREWFNQRE